MFNLLKIILLLGILYLYLHNPLFSFMGGMGICKLLYPIVLIYILLNLKIWEKICYKFRNLIYIFTSLILFSLLRGILEGELTTPYSNFIFFIECFILPSSMAIYLLKNNYSCTYFIKLVLLCSSVASIITLLCITIPSFASFVRYDLLVFDQVMIDNLSRGYGISDSLTSSYGYIQGFSAALGLFYLKNNKWYLLFLPIVLFSILFNARSGFLIFAIGILLFFIYHRNLKVLLLIPLFITFGYFSIDLFYSLDLSDGTISFVENFFNQFKGSSINDIKQNNSTANELYKMLIFPTTFPEWILGTGVNYFKYFNHLHTDVGYCIQLLYGGLVYVFLLYLYVYKIYKGLRRGENGFLLSFLFILSMLVLNIKADILHNCGFLRLMFLLYFVVELDRCINGTQESVDLSRQNIFNNRKICFPY